MPRFAPVSLLLLLSLGCGGESAPSYDRVPVSGTITMDGEPITFGSIGFLPDPDESFEGPAVYADIREGRFEIPQERGPAVGQHFLIIEVYGPAPASPDEEQEMIGSVKTMTVVPEGGLTDFTFDTTKRAVMRSDEGDM